MTKRDQRLEREMRHTTYKLLTAPACLVLAVLVSASICPTAAAVAQTLGSSQASTSNLFARDRSVAVLSRPRPDYEALGLSAGGFYLFPRFQFDTEHTDNVFAVETGSVSDFAFHARPSLALKSNWSRHNLDAFVRADVVRNDKYGTEDAASWSVGGAGQVDVVRDFAIDLGANYNKAIEPRTASNTAVSARDPIKYRLAKAYLGTSRVVGRTKLSARGDFDSYNYENGYTLTGAPIDQNSRDRKAASLEGRVDYALSPATAAFIQFTGNNKNYGTGVVARPSRDSKGYEALVGVNFELGALARGEVAVGYVSQTFDSAAYGDIHGFGSRTQLEWFPTDLTTVTVTASRGIEDAGIIGSAGYLSTDFGLGVDHELLRNFILSARLKYSNDDYNGIDRGDDRLETTLSGNYLMSRNLGVALRFNRTKQSSGGADGGPNYSVYRVTLTLTTQF